MLEDERYSMSQLREELRATADEAERLSRALADLGLLLVPPKSPVPSPSTSLRFTRSERRDAQSRRT